MTRPGPVELVDREYDPPEEGLPVDIATLTQLRHRVGDQGLERAGRVFFHVAIVCTSGEGLHEVDFTPVTLKPGRVLHVQPGQVHRWRFARNYEATVLLYRSSVQVPGGPIGPQWRDLDRRQQARAARLIDLALEEYEIERPTSSRDRALRGALELLIVNLGLDRISSDNAALFPAPYVELLAQLEDDRRWSRSVKDRADRLGYSPRTLTRACQAAVGKTAKEVIDERVLLEARRLHVHGSSTVESVGRELSFSEASNFAKFFQRLTGDNPESWRRRHSVD